MPDSSTTISRSQMTARNGTKEYIHYHSNLHPMCVPTPDSVKLNKWPKKCPLRTARHLEINPLQIGANLQCKRHSLRHYFSHYQKSAAPW